jgi:hypothetical protein
MSRATRRIARARRPRTAEHIWCDICQDAPATTSMWTCPDCGFIALAPVDVAAADPDFTTCPNCEALS